MSLNLVTGYKGTPHITAEDVGAFNAGFVGAGEYVLNTGNKFAASLTSNNIVKILDGDLIIQGRHITLKKDTFEEVTIENGESGKNRIDLIVARYTKDSDTGIENAEFVVIKGTATAGTAIEPECTVGDILSGDCTLHEMPLYRISLSGLTVGEPEALFGVVPSLENFNSVTNVIPFASSDEDTPENWAKMGNGTWSVPFGKTALIKGLFSGQAGVLMNTVSKSNGGVNVKQIMLCDGVEIFYRIGTDYAGWQYSLVDASKLWRPLKIDYSSPIVTGTYTGDGEAEQLIDLGFAPKAVLVARSDGSMVRSHWGNELGSFFYGGLATSQKNCAFWNGFDDLPIITIHGNGFKVYCGTSGEGSARGEVETNSKSTFSYIAFKS